jgi:hypothetical protein
VHGLLAYEHCAAREEIDTQTRREISPHGRRSVRGDPEMGRLNTVGVQAPQQLWGLLFCGRVHGIVRLESFGASRLQKTGKRRDKENLLGLKHLAGGQRGTQLESIGPT